MGSGVRGTGYKYGLIHSPCLNSACSDGDRATDTLAACNNLSITRTFSFFYRSVRESFLIALSLRV